MDCLRNSFKPGVVLGGRYQTTSPLNHGSFGMVFMATDLKTNDTVAVKCLTKKAAADESCFTFAVDDKSEELVLHRHLGFHSNIVNLLDSFETDAHVFLVLEFCEQGDLYEAIRVDQGPRETEHVRRFMMELVDAVSYIHSKGVYHRDIKPENIFLTRSGTVKLGDFGLATTDRWSFESSVGSDRYMSPEQYDSAGAGYDPAQADIWAVGVCLLNVLFSRNPFTTPTESDPLFLDFSRDKQSLFDVFPTMSQDTYEVIVQCMNLDPTKRSLVAARDALDRVVSFTTTNEDLDDFCSADRQAVVASANREPLRTPSIQSPQVETGSFPWAKALQTSPKKPIRQLSVIPDDESYSEDLFSKSGTTMDWFSAAAQTPSMSSIMNSSLGVSMQSWKMGRLQLPARQRPRISPMAGSLPINMAKTKNLSAMSLVFGQKEPVSKSWSDMWDEDAEAEEEERARQLQAIKELNSRTWSHESKAEDSTPHLELWPATKTSGAMGKTETISNDIDSDMAVDEFFFQEAPPAEKLSAEVPRYSPPSKRKTVDKWAALGERRRAFPGNSRGFKASEGMPKGGVHQTDMGIGYGFSSGYGVSDLYGHSQHSTFSFLNQGNNNNHHTINVLHMHPDNNNNNTNRWHSPAKERPKERPRTKGREQRGWNCNMNWRKESRHHLGDVEWVGDWQEPHF